MKTPSIKLVTLVIVAFTWLLTACSTGGEQPSQEITTLIYANLTEFGAGGVDREAVDKFNCTHEDVQIEVREYFDEDGRNGVQKLLAEIGAGQIPDIIDLGFSSSYTVLLPYQQMAQKGYLEDLWPYIENDPDLGRDALLQAPLKAAEINGGLYVAFGSVSIQTLTGAESVVGNRNSWTLADLQAAFASMPEESTVLEYPFTRDGMFSYLFRMCLNDYVNWETGQCSFDSEGFRSALEFVNSFPAEVDIISNRAANEEISKRWRMGRQMLTYHPIYNFTGIQVLDAEFGGRAAFVGYPVEDGSVGSYFNIGLGGRLAMSSSCRDKEAAWEFLRTIYLPKIFQQGDSGFSVYGFPINRADYEQLKKNYSNKYFTSETNLFGSYDIKFKCHPVTEDEIQRFEDFFNRIERTNLCDNTIYNIVKETVSPYFAGDKTLDETVAMLQNRVGLYVNEQM